MNTAMLYAMMAIEELRREAASETHDWLEWRLEISIGTGEVVSVIPLVASGANERLLH